MVSLGLAGEDGLRLCSRLRSSERTRAVPILMVAEDADMKRVAQGLEIGAHDYILRPVDRNELLARVRTQIRRKRYQDRLRANYEQSLSMALTDSLTGLFNRRYLMVHLEKILNKNKETQKALCALILDIDHFKAINDTYGHQAGDDVLKAFAGRISQKLRSFDLVARLGGEEFVVILPDISQDMAFHVAERLRASISNEAFVISTSKKPIDVTVSIGASMVQGGESLTVEDVLKRADDELYRAKETGRNRVYFSGYGLSSSADKKPPLPSLMPDMPETPADTSADIMTKDATGKGKPAKKSG
jgi:two-component system cell cycle response regulator